MKDLVALLKLVEVREPSIVASCVIPLLYPTDYAFQSTLPNCSSTDFHRKFVKFCTKLSELLKNNGIICLLEKIKKKWGKNAKQAVGGVFSSQDWSKKLSPKELLFSYASSSRLTLVSETLGRSFTLA